MPFYDPRSSGSAVTVLDEGVSLTSTVTSFNFVGSGVTASAVGNDVTVTIPGGGGGSLTQVYETATDSGNHINYTISQSPNSGSLLVINANTGQVIDSANYTNTGTALVFNSSQQQDNGDGSFTTPVIKAFYDYGTSSLTEVYETATDSGDHTSFTISYTPAANSLLVINANTGQVITPDNYTATTTTITFNSSLAIGGETPTIKAKYVY